MDVIESKTASEQLADNEANAQKRRTYLMLALFAGLFISVLLVGSYMYKTDGNNMKPITEYGGDFVLQNAQGEVALASYRDKVVVLYFGFLNCTEACPVALKVMDDVFSRMDTADLDRVQAFFISIDPERDSPAELETFSAKYDNKIMGLTGTPDQIDDLIKQYGVFIEIADLESRATGYTVDHSSRYYIINREGRLASAMTHSTTPNELMAKIKTYF